jgi:signal transduction histidine kinase
MQTYFLPAERDSLESIDKQRALFAPDAFAVELLTAVPLPLVVLNGRRQIVFANTAAQMLTGGDVESIFGQRPGEVLGCRHAQDCAGGCAAAQGLAGREAVNECRIDSVGSGMLRSLDLRVWARPLRREGMAFSVVVLADIGHEKRREALERVFFHDLMNSVGSLRSFLDLLQQEDLNAGNDGILDLLRLTAHQAFEEIAAQRTLLAAESGELEVDWQPLRSAALLRQACDIYRRNPVIEGRSLVVDAAVADRPLISDPTLVRRILGNLLLNACEASPAGGTVTLGCDVVGEGGVVFTVHNQTCMSREVQMQIFQRSFSTRGTGRGLGTYSIRLLAGYLQGAVDFSSTPDAGTTFRLYLPLKPTLC